VSSILKKIILVFSILVLVLFISLIITAWTMGMFSQVTVTRENRGPYNVVSLPHQGSYRGIHQKIDQVNQFLAEKQIFHAIACGIYYDDPAAIPLDSLISEGGWFIEDSVYVQPPYRLKEIPRRQVAVARIEANPAVAGFKTYPALNQWMQDNHYQADTTAAIVELYHPDKLVEVEVCLMPLSQN
jgi:DNA gyrase inhibitor GyrI